MIELEREEDYEDEDDEHSPRIMNLEIEGAEEERTLMLESEEEGIALVNTSRGNPAVVFERRHQRTGGVWEMLKHRTSPYLPLFVGAAVVFAVLLLSIVYSPEKQPEFLLPVSNNSAVDGGLTSPPPPSCGNFSEADVAKFLEGIDRLPQKERCSSKSLASGSSHVCRCANPLKASGGTAWATSWERGFTSNLEYVQAEGKRGRKLDVIMVGDSITEHWLGRSLGLKNAGFDENVRVYNELFNSSQPGSIQGMALGISGDRCAQLLYRLQNGEMGNGTEIPALKPKVWWVLIGTNDLVTGDSCNADSVVAGNIRIVQEIRERRPEATVVIQSLLPVLDRGSQEKQLSPILWDLYSDINERLECFATSSLPSNGGKVRFYNMTPIFFNEDQRTVNRSMLPDGIHPTGLMPRRRFGGVIAKEVRAIIRKGSRRR